MCDLPVESRRDVNDDGHGPPLQARASVAVPSYYLSLAHSLALAHTQVASPTNPSSQALPVSGSARWEARCRSIAAVWRLPAFVRPPLLLLLMVLAGVLCAVGRGRSRGKSLAAAALALAKLELRLRGRGSALFTLVKALLTEHATLFSLNFYLTWPTSFLVILVIFQFSPRVLPLSVSSGDVSIDLAHINRFLNSEFHFIANVIK